MNLKIKTQSGAKIKLNKVFPKSGNLCKLSVYCNAIKYLGYKQKSLTPEKILKSINVTRKDKGIKVLDPDKNIIPTKDLKAFLKKTGVGKSIVLRGSKWVNFDLWEELLKKSFLISSDHQEFYYLASFDEITLDHLPKDLLKILSTQKKFNYKKFVSIYSYIIKIFGPIDEGHVDLVVGLQRGTVPTIMLANLNSTDNKSNIKLPWYLYSNYFTFDWEKLVLLKSIKDLPNLRNFNKLRALGSLNDGKFNFTFGEIEVFFKHEREEELKQILSRFNK